MTSLFHKGLAAATIKVYRSSISSVLRIRNPPDHLQEEAVARLIRAVSLERPRSFQSAPAWNLGLVLRQLLLPPFTHNGRDTDISLELLTKKTVFLVALATAARASELCALSRADHNLDIKHLPSGQWKASIRCFPGFFPKNQTPDVLPQPVVFPGIAHLFPGEVDRFLCPVRCLIMYLTKSKHLAADQDNRLFVHWNKKQLRSSHISKWLVDTIQLAYESASADSKKLEGVKGHQVRSLASSWAYFRKLPLEEVRKAVGWKSRTVFSSHYLKDVQQDEEVTGPLPVVLAGNALL